MYKLKCQNCGFQFERKEEDIIEERIRSVCLKCGFLVKMPEELVESEKTENICSLQK